MIYDKFYCFTFNKEVSMKKLMFFVVAAVVASIGFCSSASEKIVSKLTNSNTFIEEQNDQLLVLEASSGDYNLLAGHSSHGSHASHASHASHRSHFSSR